MDIVFFLWKERTLYRKTSITIIPGHSYRFPPGGFFNCFRIVKNYTYYFKVGTNSENRTSGHVLNLRNLLTMSILEKRYLSRYVHIVLARSVRLFRYLENFSKIRNG